MKLKSNKNTISLFGRAIPITLIVALMVVGIASAALIANFFVVTTTVGVEAPVTLESGILDCSVNDIQTGVCVRDIPVSNSASNAILTELQTIITSDEGGSSADILVTYSVNGNELSNVDVDELQELIVENGGTTLTMAVHFLEGITPNPASSYTVTTTATVPEGVKLLTLDNKDENWNRITGDGIKGYIIYTPIGATFDYYVYAKGLAATTEYSVIYYADMPDRFVNWGGDNPGALVGTGLTSSDGTLKTPGTMSESTQVGNLPREPDANIAENFYGGAPDYYLTPHGAKLWIVPSSGYDKNTNALIGWTPSAYLFETDLINYIQT